MWQNHFTMDGQTYYTGTIFIVREFKYAYGSYETEATFIAYNPKYDSVKFRVGSQTQSRSVADVKKWVITATNRRNEKVRCPVQKRRKELEIDGMLTGWTWYVVLMAISSIFNDAIGLWGLISFIFFTWRAKKIEKDGYYLEW